MNTGRTYSDYELAELFEGIDSYFRTHRQRFILKYSVSRYSRNEIVRLVSKLTPVGNEIKIRHPQDLQGLISFINSVNDKSKPKITKNSPSNSAPYPKIIQLLQVFAIGEAKFEGLEEFVENFKGGMYKTLIKEARKDISVIASNFQDLLKVSNMIPDLQKRFDKRFDEVLKEIKELRELENKKAKKEINEMFDEMIELIEEAPKNQLKEKLIDFCQTNKYK